MAPPTDVSNWPNDHLVIQYWQEDGHVKVPNSVWKEIIKRLKENGNNSR